MNELDLKITDQQLPVIAFNFEEIKNSLKAGIAQYSTLVVTDESLSLCKQKQKELAGIRTKIDTYRKNTKREMLIPIDEFEDKCKQLVKLVEDAEKPLKDGIAVYDNIKREEKKNIALQLISESIQAHSLNEKYASQLTVIDKYMNLTAKVGEVKEDIEQRTFLLLSQQKKDEEMVEIIQDTIDNANKTIKTPLNLSDFQRLINMGMATKDILNEVNRRAEHIRQAEMPKPEPILEPIPEPNPEPVIELEPEELPAQYSVEIRVIATQNRIAELGHYLKSNGYNYKVLNQSEV